MNAEATSGKPHLFRSYERSSAPDRLTGRPGKLERSLFVGIMLVSSGLTHLAGGGDAEGGSTLAEIVWGMAYALAIVGIVVERDFSMPLLRRSIPLLSIVALALVSTLWSGDPLLSLRRSFGLFGTGAIALYVVSRYSLPAFLQLFVLTINVIALVSICMIVLTPDLGVMQGAYQGAWRGIFWEKNRFGESMEIGVMTMLLLLGSTELHERKRLWISIAMCSVLMLGSRSATTEVALLAVLASMFFIFRAKDRRLGFGAVLAGSALGILAACASVVGFTIQDVFSLFGRDATLTGRVDIWSTVVGYIWQSPVLGYGYQVFWEPSGPIRQYLEKDLGWEPVSAHNGYLEFAINFGLAGLALFLVFLIHATRTCIELSRRSDDRLNAWPLLTLISLVIMNLSDANFVLYNEFLWVIFMIAVLFGNVDDASRNVMQHSERPKRLRSTALYG